MFKKVRKNIERKKSDAHVGKEVMVFGKGGEMAENRRQQNHHIADVKKNGSVGNRNNGGSNSLSVYQVSFEAVNCGKRVASTKRRIQWRFGLTNDAALATGKTGADCQGKEHDVVIEWSVTSGKRRITINEEELCTSITRIGVFRHSWFWRGNNLTVIAHLSPIPGFPQYDLLINGRSYFNMPNLLELGLEYPLSTSNNSKHGKSVEPPEGATISKPSSFPDKLRNVLHLQKKRRADDRSFDETMQSTSNWTVTNWGVSDRTSTQWLYNEELEDADSDDEDDHIEDEGIFVGIDDDDVITSLQALVRGHSIRKRMEARKKLMTIANENTEACMDAAALVWFSVADAVGSVFKPQEFYRREKAAAVIQRAFRGHRARRPCRLADIVHSYRVHQEHLEYLRVLRREVELS